MNPRNFFKKYSLVGRREIYRIYTAHTLRGIALSIVSVYVPIFLLTLGHTLSEVIWYYIVTHLVGLAFALTLVPFLIERIGILQTFKWNYPITITYYLLLALLPSFPLPLPLIAVLGGASIFFYWVPLNIFLIKNTEFDKMGSDMAKFFALPQIFSIVGPLIGAGLILLVGFWPAFAVAMVGTVVSYLPLAPIGTSEIRVSFRFREAWAGLKKRRFLFFLEGFDNIVEESEWFWGIYIYLVIGSLAVPGIVGSLEALGGAVFTLLVGKYANKSGRKMILGAAAALVCVAISRMFIESQLAAYAVSLIASFAMTAFMVSYFSAIYRSVKGDNEEEFIILREIPTVLARMAVFGVILLTLGDSRWFFLLPIVALLVLIVTLLIRMPKNGTRITA
jgi:MFS family permease